MTVASTIKIDVDDARWVKFNEMFDKYQEQLAKTPAAWAKVNKENAAAAESFNRIAAALLTQNQMNREAAEDAKKRVGTVTFEERLWSSISRSTKEISRNLVDATGSILRWIGPLGLVSGLLGAGGLWGIDRLAGGIADQRRTATGLGLNIGQQRAFDINLQRYGNPSAILSSVSDATQLGRQGPLYSLGVNPNQGTADVLIDTLKAVRKLAQATPADQLGILAQTRTGALGFDLEALRNLRKAGNPEFDATLANIRRDSTALNVSDRTAESWRSFYDQMHRASDTISKTFVIGLTPLIPSLKDLSEAFVGLIKVVMPGKGGGPIENGIKQISTWINDFAGVLKDGKFKETVTDLVSSTGAIAQTMHTIADAIQHPGDALGNAMVNDVTSNQVSRWNALTNVVSGIGNFASHKIAQALFADKEKRYGLPAGTLDYIYGHESDFGRKMVNDKGLDTGRMGLVGPNATGVDIHSVDQSGERAAQILQRELIHYRGNLEQALGAYRYGEKGLADIQAKYGKDWREHVDYFTRDKQNHVHVTLTSPPGNNPILVMATQTR